MFKACVESVVKNYLKWIDFFSLSVNKNIQRHFLILNIKD
ncbi:hypothetical protein OUM_0262 [Helicobacter pylori R038b]|uniref:Uncharacterized protein n=1 Tax=Helicobacter pylori R038b TaxID=1145115 RepID=K2KYW2_HELPX|nr:hypothetical protein OUM_0262 [Helicobacter pylori R038b]